MKNKRKNLLPAFLGAFTIILAIPAEANFSWSYDSNPQAGSCPGGGQLSLGNTCTQSSSFDGQTIGVSATGWASSSNSTGSALQKATLNVWDGLSVQAQGEAYSDVPEHATDNNGKLESILFSFDKSVRLTNITMGWHRDTDFSLLRLTGNGAANLEGKNYDNLITDGWELVGNYTYGSGASNGTDLTASVTSSNGFFSGPKDEDNNDKLLDTDNLSSSYWLVTALNGAFWNDSRYIGNDYFKLKNLSGVEGPSDPPGNNSVPEPSTLALMTVVFAGVGFTRRKSNL